VVPDIYKVITAPHIQATIFDCTYLRCNWKYSDTSIRVVLQIWCQIQRTSSSLRYVTCGPAIYNVITAPRIQATIFDCTYLRCNWKYSDISIRVILQIWCQIQLTSSCLRYVTCGPGHIQSNYCSAYSGYNIRLYLSALQLEIFRQFDPRYTANMVSNTAHIVQFTLCDLWSRPYTKYLQFRIIRLQYSNDRICAAIGDISTIQWALYYKHCAKYSAHPPVYSM
jgi:hypothetical protein